MRDFPGDGFSDDCRDVPVEASRIAVVAHFAGQNPGVSSFWALPEFLTGARVKVRGHDILTDNPSRHQNCFSEQKIAEPEGLQ